MGKGRVGKGSVIKFAKTRSPQLQPTKPLTFKEVKLRSILAGLRCLRAPAVIAVIITSLFASPSLKWGPQHELDHLELFAGKCSVSIGEFQEGRKAAMAMDFEHNPATMDLLSTTGFVAALYHTTCLKPGAGFLAAPVCSSFVYMNSGTSRRSVHQPLGHEAYPSVDSGNKLCARTLVCVWVAAALGAWWLIEQPQGSMMQYHPAFQHILKALQVYRHRLQMGDYGGKSEKPTWLYSCDERISQLADFRPPSSSRTATALVDRYVDSSGKSRIKGNANLKLSQAYPLGFGRALAKLRTRHATDRRREAMGLIKEHVKKHKSVKRNTRKDSMWIKCANLTPILEYLA